MVSDAMRKIGSHVFQFQPFDEELGQLVDAGDQRRHVCCELIVASQPGRARVDITHHTGAGCRRGHDDLSRAKDLDKAPDECQRLVLVAGIVVHLPAACLFLRKIDRVAEALNQLYRCPSRLWEKGIIESGDNERKVHSTSSFVSDLFFLYKAIVVLLHSTT
jgi:hypothetical protein